MIVIHAHLEGLQLQQLLELLKLIGGRGFVGLYFHLSGVFFVKLDCVQLDPRVNKPLPH